MSRRIRRLIAACFYGSEKERSKVGLKRKRCDSLRSHRKLGRLKRCTLVGLFKR